MGAILAGRIEIHLYYPGRHGQPRKVIAWGENAVMDYARVAMDGMEMDAAKDTCIAKHAENFGRHLGAWMRCGEGEV